MVVGDVAVGVGSTGRWVASFFWVGDSARAEGVAGITSGASTDGDVVADIAVSIDSAGPNAGVDTVLVHTALVAAALAVVDTFDLDAGGKRIAGVSRQAGADGPHAAVDAVRSRAAGVRPARHQVVGDRAPVLVQVTAQVVAGIVVVVALSINAS